MLTVACVLREGPEYKAKHINTLANSLQRVYPGQRLLCLTDCDVRHPIVDVKPLKHDWPGWWSKMELFRLKGPVVYFDIDTMIIDRLPTIDFTRFTMLPNCYRKGDVGSGVMAWSGDYSYLTKAFAKDPARHMAEYKTSDKWGDQAFIRDHLREAPAVFGDHFRSYKAHCRRGIPRNTSVVYFHGKPRPWEVNLRWR